MSDLLRLASTQWPRLYLDTAELLYIADRRVDQHMVSDLVNLMRARGVILTLGLDHFEDAIPGADPAATSKLADALEQFPLRAIITKTPSDIEPWMDGPTDITIEAAGNIREVMHAPLAMPTLQWRATATGAMHDVNTDFQRVRLQHNGPPLARPEHEIFILCMCTLVLGRMGSDATEILNHHEAEKNTRLAPSARKITLDILIPIAELMARATAIEAPTQEQRRRLLTQLKVYFDDESYLHSPGLFLASRVALCRMRNLRRIPQRSDHLDGQHAAYLPYVDIATCDRQTYSCVEPLLGKDTFPRRVTLIRNGSLRDVLRAVERLPQFPAVNPESTVR